MTEKSIEAEYNKYKDDTPVTMERQNVGVSPCEKCPNEDGSKDQCVEECLRLKEFQFNRPYKHIEFYCSQEHAEPLKDAQMAAPLQETPKTTELRTQETASWKKAMPKKQKKKATIAQKPKDTIPAPMTYEEKLKIIRETTICLVCGRDASKYPLRRGLCLSKCSGAWRDGRVTHPLLGVFSKMSPKEVHDARWGEHSKCLMPDCEEVGDRRGLCRKCYRKWIGNYIKHPELGKWFPKGQKKKKEVAVEDQVEYKINLETKDDESVTKQEKVVSRGLLPEAKQEKLISHSVLLDFTDYPLILNELRKQMELSKLPLSHTIINVLSIGISSAYEEDQRRRGNALHK